MHSCGAACVYERWDLLPMNQPMKSAQRPSSPGSLLRAFRVKELCSLPHRQLKHAEVCKRLSQWGSGCYELRITVSIVLRAPSIDALQSTGVFNIQRAYKRGPQSQLRFKTIGRLSCSHTNRPEIEPSGLVQLEAEPILYLQICGWGSGYGRRE